VQVLETERLALRRMSIDDAAFILELLTDPDFVRCVGDRGVRTVDDARNYIVSGPLDSYERLGFGLFLVEEKASTVPVGICGLLRRPTLPEVDIGFALLPAYRSRGYACESAAAVMQYAHGDLAIGRVVAIANTGNAGSIRVLEKIGLRFDRMIRLSDEAPEVGLYTEQPA
jgi:[ribosomal protein S5]-alanine N-acetyltransferase